MRRSRHRLAACRRDHGERAGRRNGLRSDTGTQSPNPDRSAIDRRSLVARACPDGRPHARPAAERRSRAGLCLSGVTRSQVLLDRAGRPLVAARCCSATSAPWTTPRKSPAIFRPPIPPTRSRRSIRSRASRGSRGGSRNRSIASARSWNRRTSSISGSPARSPTDSVTYSRYDHLRAPKRPLPDWLERCRQSARAAPDRAVADARAASRTGNPRWNRLAGIPVFAGAMDAWATAVGAGAIRAGQGYDIAGTSEVAGLDHARPRRRAGPRFRSIWGEKVAPDRRPDAGRRRLRVVVPSNASAFAVRSRRRSSAPARCRRPAIGRCSCPISPGERTPLWRADVRGAFEGSVARTSTPTISSGRCWKAWRWRCATFSRARSTDRGETVRGSRCRRRQRDRTPGARSRRMS